MLPEEELKVLDGLKDNKDIVTNIPDKGNGMVFLHKTNDSKKMEEILQDVNRFKRFAEDPKHTFQRETKIKNFLRTVKNPELSPVAYRRGG